MTYRTPILSYSDYREDLNDEISAFIQQQALPPEKKAPMPITIKTIIVTPTHAKDFLANMVHNRPLSDANVLKYAREILAGRWGLTSQGLIFDEVGRLLDGQHRLHAVIKANRPIQTTATFGVSEKMFPFLDGGNKRTSADALDMKNRNVIAGALKYMYRINIGRKWSSDGVRPHPADALALVKRFPSIVDSAEAARAMRRTVPGLTPSAMAFCHFMANRENKLAGESFFKGLASGANLSDKSPILILRNALAPVSGTRVIDTTSISLFIVGWKMYLNKGSAKYIKIPSEIPDWNVGL